MTHQDTEPKFALYTMELSYLAPEQVDSLGWYNITRCARERMLHNCENSTRWKGEWSSLYMGLQKMRPQDVSLTGY